MMPFAFLSFVASTAMTLLLIVTGASLQTTYPFMTSTQKPASAKENATVEVTWKIVSCDWQVKIVTENDTLYPLDELFEEPPIKNGTDYNVTTKCQRKENSTTVTLSIAFSKKVLNNANYVVCKVSTIQNFEIVYKSRVNFTTTPPTIEPMLEPSTDTTTDNTPTVTVETATSSGHRLCVHFRALILYLIIVSLAFLWISWL